MQRGYVKLWRKSMGSRVFSDDHLWKMWTWCLMKATHKTHTVSVPTGRGDTLVTLKPGQFVFGRDTAAEELGCPPSSARRRIDSLRKREMVDIQPDTHFSIVTIRNWEHYQSVDAEVGQATGQASGQASGQAKDTYKNVKNNTSPHGVADANAAKGKPRGKTFYDEHGIPYPVLSSRPPDPDVPHLNDQAKEAEEGR